MTWQEFLIDVCDIADVINEAPGNRYRRAVAIAQPSLREGFNYLEENQFRFYERTKVFLIDETEAMILHGDWCVSITPQRTLAFHPKLYASKNVDQTEWSIVRTSYGLSYTELRPLLLILRSDPAVVRDWNGERLSIDVLYWSAVAKEMDIAYEALRAVLDSSESMAVRKAIEKALAELFDHKRHALKVEDSARSKVHASVEGTGKE